MDPKGTNVLYMKSWLAPTFQNAINLIANFLYTISSSLLLIES